MEILKNLLKVKSIVTLTLTAVFAYLCTKGSVPQELQSVFTVVIGFYFGTQMSKGTNS